jgi:hypothetical protein
LKAKVSAWRLISGGTTALICYLGTCSHFFGDDDDFRCRLRRCRRHHQRCCSAPKKLTPAPSLRLPLPPLRYILSFFTSLLSRPGFAAPHVQLCSSSVAAKQWFGMGRIWRFGGELALILRNGSRERADYGTPGRSRQPPRRAAFRTLDICSSSVRR